MAVSITFGLAFFFGICVFVSLKDVISHSHQNRSDSVAGMSEVSDGLPRFTETSSAHYLLNLSTERFDTLEQ